MSSPARRSWLAPPLLTEAVAVATDHLALVQVEWTANGPRLVAHAAAPIAAGLVTPAVNASNIADPGALAERLREQLDALPRRATRVALVLPDHAARVSLVRFQQVPTRTTELDQLIRWHVRKAAPFRVEDAQVSYTRGAETPDGEHEFVVVMVRRDIVEEYERVCMEAGVHAGLVDLVSLNLINAVLWTTPPDVEGDWLLIHVAPEQSTLAIVRNRHLIFFRNRATSGWDSLTDLVHQTAMYYEDRLGGHGLTRALVSGLGGGLDADAAGPDHAAVRRTLEERLQTALEPVGGGLAARGVARPDTPLDLVTAPLGILLRDRAS